MTVLIMAGRPIGGWVGQEPRMRRMVSRNQWPLCLMVRTWVS